MYIKISMFYNLYIILCTIFFMVFAQAAIANNKNDTGEHTSILDKIKMSDTDKRDKGNDLEMNIWCADIEHENAQKKCWEATEARFHYYKKGLDHRSDVFKWQHLSSKIIFIIVLVVVSMGLYFSWIQFKKDIINNDTGPTKNTDNTLELSTSGIKVSSPVLGIIILTLSLVFFYLYLVFVYPITEVI